MDVIKMSIARLRAQPFQTSLSLLLFGVGVAIISLLIHFETQSGHRFRNNIAGIDLVVGAKGSPLQLILSSVFHADVPTGNISLAEAEKISRNPMVRKTIPIALGDNHRGYRIVGTNLEYPQHYKIVLGEGRWFDQSMEAVIGSDVAKRTGLQLGDHFTGVHGFHHVGHSHDDYEYTVTGIMQPNGSVLDKLILTPVESVWEVHASHQDHDDGHEHEDDGHDHHDEEIVEQKNDDTGSNAALQSVLKKIEAGETLTIQEVDIFNKHKGNLRQATREASAEITALLVFYNTPTAAAMLPRMINENTALQAASPALELNRLLGLLGYGITTLKVLAWIIILFSGLNILIHLLNTLSQSLGEVALIRALGASRLKVLMLLLSQGIFLAVGGWLAGLLLARIIWWLIPSIALIDISGLWAVSAGEMVLLYYCLVVGVMASIFPAIKAYKTNIHFILSGK
jgi:putative ABC transport system permease protein